MNSKLGFVCLLVTAFASVAESTSSDKTMAIQFTPPENTTGDISLRLNPLLIVKNLTSYSICLRANLQTWDDNWLFDSMFHKLILNDYKTGTGIYCNGELFQHQFDYKKSLQ